MATAAPKSGRAAQLTAMFTPTPGFGWPDSLSVHIANCHTLDDLEPSIIRWIAERLEQRAAEGHEVMRATAYACDRGKFERKYAEVVESYRGLIARAPRGAEDVLERMACREEAFTRYEAELVTDPALCDAVWHALIDRVSVSRRSVLTSFASPSRRSGTVSQSEM
jgi:hypothetical protein